MGMAYVYLFDCIFDSYSVNYNKQEENMYNQEPPIMTVAVVSFLLLLTGVLLLGLSGCSNDPFPAVSPITAGPQGPVGPQGPAGTPAPIAPITPIEQIVANYNAERISVGQEPVVPGLTCTLSNVPSTTTCLSATTGPSGCLAAVNTTVGSFEYLGVFNQANEAGTAGFSVLPAALQPDFSTNFRVTCTGLLFTVDDAWHNMSLASDDGAVVRVNNLVLNNDGEHAIATVSGSVFLNNLQPYSFSLDYFQGPGNVALVLQEDGSVMDSAGFYH